MGKRVEQPTIGEFEKLLKLRWEGACELRKTFEPTWERNRSIAGLSPLSSTNPYNISFQGSADDADSLDEDAGSTTDIGTNYIYKYVRFFQSQLSANPPMVLAKPTSTDYSDLQKADAANKLIRYIHSDKDLQEIVDLTNLEMLVAGSGVLKQVWNPDKGDTFDYNEETSELDLDGDIEVLNLSLNDFWADSGARRWADVRFTFERITMSLEDAKFRFPDHADMLEELVRTKEKSSNTLVSDESRFDKEPTVDIYEYYERAAPVNGMAGRHCYMTEDCKVVGELGRNPHWHAQLPYHFITYVDNPGYVYGKSVVEYAAPLQENLNGMDMDILDSISLHGSIKMGVPDSSELGDGSITDDSGNIIRFSGDARPGYINPPALMQDIWKFRDSIILGIQELFGINDSMLGIQRREQSALSQQTSIESGLAIHRRMYKKEEMLVEGLYRAHLGLIRDNWDISRVVLVIGKGKAFESADIKGADIAGGFDITVEYGTGLPLDPNMRREAIILLWDKMVAAGMSDKKIFKHLKLDDLEGIHDRMEMAGERCKEDFEEMIASYKEGTPIYIAPEEISEHQGRLEYAYDYIESPEFKYLEEDLQRFIRQHIKEREGYLRAQGQPAPAAPQPAIPGMPGVGGAMAPGPLEGII